MKKSSMVSLSLVFAALLVAGCADKNLEDYQEQKLSEDLAKYQSAAGTYAGTVFSNVDNSAMGVLRVELTPRTLTAKGDGKLQQVAALEGKYSFEAARKLKLTASDGSYYPETNRYQAEVAVPGDQGSSKGTLNINGLIKDGKFSGSIEAKDHGKYGGYFVLEKDLPYEQAIQAGLSAGLQIGSGNSGTQLEGYRGKTTFANGVARSVEIYILDPASSPEEDLLNAFLPYREKQLTLNYGESVRYEHTVRWEASDSSLIGATKLGQPTYLSVECRKLSDKLLCDHYTSGGGLAARSEAVRVSNPKDKPSVGTDDPASRQEITKIFAGSTSGGGFVGTIKGVRFQATMPARSRTQEISELFLPPSERGLRVTVVFQLQTSVGTIREVAYDFDSKWDLATGALNGVEPSSKNTIFLSCPKFDLFGEKGAFECAYTHKFGKTDLKFIYR